MQKLCGLFLLSAALVGCGAFLLLRVAKGAPEIKAHVVVDFEESCNENDYLYYGVSPFLLDTQKENEEQFLVVAQDQSLHDILSLHKVSAQEIMALTKALGPHMRATDLAVGDLYNFTLSKDGPVKVQSFTIRKLDPNRLPITYVAKAQKGAFEISLSSPKTVEEDGYVEIKVKDTLFQSFKSIPYGHELMQRLMNVLAWRMRMPEQVAKNDVIEILVTKIFAEQKFIGYGKIKSVIYNQPHQTLKAFYFNSSDGHISGYYDDKGLSLEKEMLLSPVQNTIATSDQQLRYHPVIKSRIRHNGIDFRGTIGTEFFSIADGEIIEKRFDKNVGNMIRIRHKGGVHSEYFHADSLVEKLNVGDRVRRGQKIGEIGRTGRLCTGPHLHLGLYLLHGDKRKYIDFKSLRKKLADMPRLVGVHRNEFMSQSAKSLSLMEEQRQKRRETLVING